MIDDLWKVGVGFRNRYHVRTTSQRGVQGDVSAVSSHDFDQKHSVVTGRGITNSVDGFDGRFNRGRKSDRVIGAVKIVVDRAGASHNLTIPNFR